MNRMMVMSGGAWLLVVILAACARDTGELWSTKSESIGAAPVAALPAVPAGDVAALRQRALAMLRRAVLNQKIWGTSTLQDIMIQ